MTTHALNISSRWFQRVADLEKTAEVREHNRDYQAGDELELWELGEWNRRTGRYLTAEIRHVLPANLFPEGIQEDYCLLSLGQVSDILTDPDAVLA
jgi:hypothetical protein